MKWAYDKFAYNSLQGNEASAAEIVSFQKVCGIFDIVRLQSVVLVLK